MAHSEAKKSTWAALSAAALQFAKSTTGDRDAAMTLHTAALAYAEACRGAATPARRSGSGEGSDLVVGFGKSKGKRVSELTDRDLDWYAGALERSIDDPERERFRSQNQAMLDAIRAERATR